MQNLYMVGIWYLTQSTPAHFWLLQPGMRQLFAYMWAKSVWQSDNISALPSVCCTGVCMLSNAKELIKRKPLFHMSGSAHLHENIVSYCRFLCGTPVLPCKWLFFSQLPRVEKTMNAPDSAELISQEKMTLTVPQNTEKYCLPLLYMWWSWLAGQSHCSTILSSCFCAHLQQFLIFTPWGHCWNCIHLSSLHSQLELTLAFIFAVGQWVSLTETFRPLRWLLFSSVSFSLCFSLHLFPYLLFHSSSVF